MIKSIPFQRKHLEEILPNSSFANWIDGYKDMEGFLSETVVNVQTGDILAVLTGKLIFEKNLEVHTIIGARAVKTPISFVRHLKARLLFYEEKLNVDRIQCAVRVGYPFLVKFIEAMGFHVEGYMKKFGSEGDDYMLYARVK